MKIAGGYAALGVLWISTSGWLLHHFVHDAARAAVLEDVKGWFFVLVTAVALWLALERYFQRIRGSLRQTRESEQKLRLVGDHLPESYVYQYTRDREGKPQFNYISARVQRVHGVSVAEALHDAGLVLSQLQPAQAKAYLAGEQESARTLRAFEMEFGMRRRDGQERTLYVLSQPSRDEAGRVRWDGFAQDVTEHRRAEQALRASEAKWRSYIENAPVGVLVADETGRHVEANRCVEEMLGYEPGGLLQTHVADLPAEANGPEMQEHFKELAAKGYASGQFLLRRKDGSTVWALVRALRLQGGRVLGIFQNITELKRVEQALREREQQLQLFVENSPAAIAMLDGEMRYLVASRRWMSDFRLQERDLLGKSHYEVFPDLPERWKEVHRRCLNGAVERSDGDMFPRADGTIDWLRWEVRPWRTAGGEVGGLIIFSEMITEAKRAEEALRRSEENFRAMFEVASIGMAQTDPRTGQWVRVNRKMCEITGYSEAELLEASVPELTHLEDRERDWELYQRVIRGEAPDYQLEKRYLRKDGSVAWVNVNMTVIRDAVGLPIRTMATIEDITERKRLQTHLLQAQKMEAIGQLAGGVAHDFNNILAAMIMQAELAAGAADLSPQARESFQEIRSAAERAANLTRQLLLFSRRQVMQMQMVDLNEVVTGLSRMLQRIIGEDIRLQLDLHPAALVVHADAGMLDQVVMNLAVNARDAMPDGGRLLIETGETVLDADSARLYAEAKPGRHVWLSVSDTGGGIPPEVLPRIFEPFFTTKEVGKGTGLGLATVFGVVKQHQGWIDVESDPGQGASFHVFLPAAAAAAPGARQPEAPKSKPRGGTETIFVVEDDAPLRAATQKLLTRNGYTVVEASHGAEALELWAQYRGRVALLLTDLVMPSGVTGQELARQLRLDQPDLKVIFTSGYSAEIAARGIQLQPGQNFVQKPCPPDQLLESVRRCLDG